MSKRTRNVVIGSVLGLGAGCVLGSVRAVAAVSPVIWPLASAVSGGALGYVLTKEHTKNVPLTVVGTAVGTVAGGAAGTVCVPLAPIVTPLMLVESACLPIVCCVLGGYLGYKS